MQSPWIKGCSLIWECFPMLISIQWRKALEMPIGSGCQKTEEKLSKFSPASPVL